MTKNPDLTTANAPVTFPRDFHIGLPGGGAIIVYRGVDNFMVVDWDRDHDAGDTVGIFGTLAVAISAARAHAAKAWGVQP